MRLLAELGERGLVALSASVARNALRREASTNTKKVTQSANIKVNTQYSVNRHQGYIKTESL